MPMPTHEVFRVLLQIGDVDSLWTFRIHDDDTLQIDIECTGDTPTPQAMTTDSAIRDFDHHVDFTYITTEHVLEKNTPSPGMYTCSFYLAQREEGNQYVAYSYVQKLTCILSRELGFQCRLNKLVAACDRFAALNKALLHPVAWSVAVEPVRATLYPLTCGVYTLKGGLMNHELGLFSPIIMHVELLPGGRVAGTGFESGYHRTSGTTPLTSTWSEDSLEISQSFVEFPPRFRIRRLHLRGRVTKYALSSQFTYDNAPFREEQALATTHLRVTAMRRNWSPDVHKLFPETFKEATRWCLLSSQCHRKLDKLWLPSVLWPHVFQYCDSSWFS